MSHAHNAEDQEIQLTDCGSIPNQPFVEPGAPTIESVDIEFTGVPSPSVRTIPENTTMLDGGPMVVSSILKV